MFYFHNSPSREARGNSRLSNLDLLLHQNRRRCCQQSQGNYVHVTVTEDKQADVDGIAEL